jgi:hypothetical protein
MNGQTEEEMMAAIDYFISYPNDISPPKIRGLLIKLKECLQSRRTVTRKEIKHCIVTNWDSGKLEWEDTIDNICSLFKGLGIKVEK